MIFKANSSNVSSKDIVPSDIFLGGIITCECAPDHSNFDPKTGMGTISSSNMRNDKDILRLPIYNSIVNNANSAASLPDSNISEGLFFNDNS